MKTDLHVGGAYGIKSKVATSSTPHECIVVINVTLKVASNLF